MNTPSEDFETATPSPPRGELMEDGTIVGKNFICYSPIDFVGCFDMRRSNCSAWVEFSKYGYDATDLPPSYIVKYPDLLQEGWGWERLVPYDPCYIGWPDFKQYLEFYFEKNTRKVATLCALDKPKSVGQGVHAEFNELHAAANMCIEVENKLLRGFVDFFTLEEICLSTRIKDHARHLIQSGGESSVAVAGLVCITKEAELMCELFTCSFNITPLITLCNKVRRSASSLMLYKGSKFAAATAGAMLGMAHEANFYYSLLTGEDPNQYLEYVMCDGLRQSAAKIFAKLEEVLSCKTTDSADAEDSSTSDTAEKPTGVEVEEEVKVEGEPKEVEGELEVEGEGEWKYENKLSFTVAKDKGRPGKPLQTSELT